MALIDNTAGRRVDVPHEPGEWMEFRALTWPEVDKARKIKQRETFQDIGSMGPDAMKQIQSMQSDVVSDAVADPLTQMDMLTVLTLGVVGWSYPAEVTIANLERLDEATARWAALEVIQAPNGAERKNSSNGSTDTSTVTESHLMSG